MALREFADVDGRLWSVWDVTPGRNYDNVVPGHRHSGETARNGWLAFECGQTGERRRLVPAPDDWPSRTDAELRALCEAATQMPARRRLIE